LYSTTPISRLESYIKDKMAVLNEDMKKAQELAGVNSPGFNQNLGAFDELNLLLNEFFSPGE